MMRHLSWRDRLFRIVLFYAVPLWSMGCGSTKGPADATKGPRDPAELNVALLPDEAAAKIIQDNQGLKEYLTKELGKPIKLHVLTSYAAMIEAVRARNIDLAYFGPLSYCLARSKCDIECFAAKTKDGKTTYRSILIANKDAGIKDFAGVKGKKMGFGDVASTSSHLMPKYTLFKKAGLREKRDYTESFLGHHDVVAINVQAGNVDAGGLNEFIYAGMLERGKIDLKKIVVLGYSDPWPDYPWAYQNDLAPQLRDKIRSAFLALKNPEILKPLKADGFAPMTDKDYDVIRSSARELGINIGELEK
jgi:phosphonate transport system substrate-binding protein